MIRSFLKVEAESFILIMIMKVSKQAKPFLKWAGGKSQLLEQIEPFFPNELAQGSIDRYVEPFVGGGAVFLHIANLYPVQEYFIFDLNPELILAYKTIQTNVEDLIQRLWKTQEQYLSLPEEERKQFFYQIRSDFNCKRKQINFDTYRDAWLKRTTELIFLNRTCFNGLFRVNGKGEFNVPFGRYKKPRICDAENLKVLADRLKKAHIEQGDFTQCQGIVNDQSFVYFDPPYRPISQTANFKSYSQQLFNDQEQIRLRDFFQLLDETGAKLLLSNSDPKNENPNDDFFEQAYAGYNIEKVKATRNINSQGSKRGKINELLIMNY